MTMHAFPRGMGTTAMRLLARREMTVLQLKERLELNYPNAHVDVAAVIESLTERQCITRDGELYGLTNRGVREATEAEHGVRAMPINHCAPLCASSSAVEPPPVERSEYLELLTQSKFRPRATPADLATPPLRPGAGAAAGVPSRMGNRLHHRDGRVTDLAGNPITAPEGAAA